MDCKSVMAPIKISLYADEPAGAMIDFMVEKHMGLVPVVERDGTFAGLVSGDGLMTHLLPKALTALGRMVFHGGGFRKASFLHESAEDMNVRLEALRVRPIRDMLDRDVKVAHPETPLIDALMMIKSKQYVVPVVDHDRKLVGAISFFSVLYGLREEYNRETVDQLREDERKRRAEAKMEERRETERREGERRHARYDGEPHDERRHGERRDGERRGDGSDGKG
ncbi:MAG: CBS domain-containing protein [Alphaproteobacteria bacterium]|nr:CBS domain-containing protein [Alphaproteobacteria bacterium]